MTTRETQPTGGTNDTGKIPERVRYFNMFPESTVMAAVHLLCWEPARLAPWLKTRPEGIKLFYAACERLTPTITLRRVQRDQSPRDPFADLGF